MSYVVVSFVLSASLGLFYVCILSVDSCFVITIKTPMQYTAIFHGCKTNNFQFNFFDYFKFLLKTLTVGRS